MPHRERRDERRKRAQRSSDYSLFSFVIFKTRSSRHISDSGISNDAAALFNQARAQTTSLILYSHIYHLNHLPLFRLLHFVEYMCFIFALPPNPNPNDIHHSLLVLNNSFTFSLLDLIIC